MRIVKTKHNRRSFLKVSTLASGGFIIGFNLGCQSEPIEKLKAIPSEWFDINAYIKVGNTGMVTIYSANPEIGQNVKTSMPMIVAEELDVAWKDVLVEQTGLNTMNFKRQVAGGSQSIRKGWESLRMAGASARHLLLETAAKKWQLDAAQLTVSNGVVTNPNGEILNYGELAAEVVDIEIPEELILKDPKDFKIIGKSTQNVDMDKLLSGEALFGIDTKKEGMQYATAVRPPSFGQELDSFDDTEARQVNGVVDVIRFGNKIAVIANNTWSAMKAGKLINAKWKKAEKLEDTDYHNEALNKLLNTASEEPRRVDGDVNLAFAESDEIFEKTYAAPFLPHSCMEPMNFYAEVNEEGVYCLGPIQTPEWTQKRISDLLKIDLEKVKIDMTRMGGGFGRRLYGDFALEAAEISSLTKKPVQLVFSREDDMHAGTYRPASQYKFKVGIKEGKIHAYHLVEACVNGKMFDPMPNNFPAGAIDHFRVESNTLESNITTGAWRAPYANFLAYAEQAFLDELSEKMDIDAVQFRLDLLSRAKENPVGENNNYEIEKYAGVIKLAAEKAGWGTAEPGVFKGFSAYFSHNTYVAEVAEVIIKNKLPVIKKITCAVDCGIVVNPIAAINQIEGGIIDGLGHAMYGDFSFKEGRAEQSNYHQYRLLRMDEAPEIEVHFVESYNDPTGLGEPTLPPAGGAVANALAAATGKRFYSQPFEKLFGVIG